MLLRSYRTGFINRLAPLHGEVEAESFFYIALEELKGWRRTYLALNPDARLNEQELRAWNEVLEQLEQHKPIQYIFGRAHFYGLQFEVNAHTLIPRPETEELVEWIIKDNKNAGEIKVLDIGTGSGCIAISVAKNLPDAGVSAMDVSDEALAVANRNAQHNGVVVNFVKQDILSAVALPDAFDVIVSNPPYVRNLEKQEIKENVLQYEPHLALFVDDNDALLFYRKIAQLAKMHLTKNGVLYFEINQYLGEETRELLEQSGFKKVELRKDIYGNDRMIKAGIS